MFSPFPCFHYSLSFTSPFCSILPAAHHALRPYYAEDTKQIQDPMTTSVILARVNWVYLETFLQGYTERLRNIRKSQQTVYSDRGGEEKELCFVFLLTVDLEVSSDLYCCTQ